MFGMHLPTLLQLHACSEKGKTTPSKLLQGKVQKQLEWKNQRDLQQLSTKRKCCISSSQSWSLNAEDWLPARLRTAWVLSEWRGSFLWSSALLYNLTSRDQIGGLSCSLSLFTMHSCQNASCTLWLAHIHTHLANHHNIMVLKHYELVRYNFLTYLTKKIWRNKNEVSVHVGKKAYNLHFIKTYTSKKMQHVFKLVLHYPASKWGWSDRIHPALCFFISNHTAVHRVFVMQVYSTSLVWITECITADFPKSDVTNVIALRRDDLIW